MSPPSGIRELARRLGRARRLTVLTGAGVSAASGIPTFRGPAGLWKSFRPEELATPAAFARDPRTVWEWYDWRRGLASRARPNRAHEVLAAWSRRYPSFTLITQNVDGLHERAGTKNVIRFHGSLWEVGCAKRCDGGRRWTDERVPLPELPPPCPRCGDPMRPGVVWFGEPVGEEELSRAAEALDCDVFLVVGTSSIVHPAASLAVGARGRGAWLAEINPETTPESGRMDLEIAARAEEALDEVEAILAAPEPPA